MVSENGGGIRGGLERRVRLWRGKRFVFFHPTMLHVVGGAAAFDGCGDWL